MNGSRLSTATSASLPGAMVPRFPSCPMASAASDVKALRASSMVSAYDLSMTCPFLLWRFTMLCMVNQGLQANGWAPAVSELPGGRAPAESRVRMPYLVTSGACLRVGS